MPVPTSQRELSGPRGSASSIAPRFFCRELREKKERVIIVHHSWEDGVDLQRVGGAKMTASANAQEAWCRWEVVDLNP